MKRIIGTIAAVGLILALMGCASAPSASDGMQDAKRNAPEGALIGMGTGKDAAAAETEAKNSLKRALTTMSRNMLQDASGAGEFSAEVQSAVLQGISTAISRYSLNDAVKLGQGVGQGKVAWSVYYLEKPLTSDMIKNAVDASKKANPGAENFTIDSRFDAEYAKAAARDWN